MYWKVIGNHGVGFQKSHQTGVMKLNFLYFEVYLQDYSLKSNKT